MLLLPLSKFWMIFKQVGNRYTESIRNSHQRPHGGVPTSEFQIRQITALHGRAFGQSLL
jgi:hypothetical protein